MTDGRNGGRHATSAGSRREYRSDARRWAIGGAATPWRYLLVLALALVSLGSFAASADADETAATPLLGGPLSVDETGFVEIRDRRSGNVDRPAIRAIEPGGYRSSP